VESSGYLACAISRSFCAYLFAHGNGHFRVQIINNKGFHFSFLLHLSIPFWCELYSGGVKNGAYCRKQRRHLGRRQSSTKQFDLKPEERRRASCPDLPPYVVTNALRPSSGMQHLPFNKLFKGCNSLSLTAETATIKVGIHLTSRYRSPPRNIP
jgi:hypothetical protein